MSTNPFTHQHHHHDHDTRDVDALAQDPGQRAMSDALRVTFLILKFLIAVLIVLYLLSGIVWGIPKNKVGVLLRFGAIVGEGDDARLQSGKIYFAFPYPIDELVLVPTAPQPLELTSNQDFWYEQSPETAQPARTENLDPQLDGSLITSDKNIIHAQFTVQYQITNPVTFLTNACPPNADERRMLAAAAELVRAATRKAAVHVIASTPFDDAARALIDKPQLLTRAQKSLDDMNSGISLVPNSLTVKGAPPAAVANAFQEVLKADSERAQKIEKARQDRSRILNEVAGPAHPLLLAIINRYERLTTTRDEQGLKSLDAALDYIFDHGEVPAWAASSPASGASGGELWEAIAQMRQAETSRDKAALATAGDRLNQLLDARQLPPNARQMIALGGDVSRTLSEARTFRSKFVSDIKAEALAFNPQAFDPATLDPAAPRQGELQQYRLSREYFTSLRWLEALEDAITGDTELMLTPQGQIYIDLNRDPAFQQLREQTRIKAAQPGQPPPTQ